jgi:outer membrane protein
MKFRIILLLFIVFVGFNKAEAQATLKIGHVNVQELVQTHPDIDSIHAVLEQETKDMEEVYADMLQEQQTKMDVFEKESAGYSEVIKKARQEELLDLSQKIQNYNQNAQQQIRQRNMQLLQPVYQQVTTAINDVSKEKGLTYVLDISAGNVAYVAPDALDITPLVKKRLEK